MPKADRDRARLTPRDLPAIFRRAAEKKEPFDQQAHLESHRERVLLYQSTSTLVTTAGTEFYSPFNGEIKWVKASVAGAPSGADFLVDLKLNGESAFESDYLTIPDGAKFGYAKPTQMLTVTGTEDPEPTPLRVQINTISGATGPMLLYIGLVVD